MERAKLATRKKIEPTDTKHRRLPGLEDTARRDARRPCRNFVCADLRLDSSCSSAMVDRSSQRAHLVWNWRSTWMHRSGVSIICVSANI